MLDVKYVMRICTVLAADYTGHVFNISLPAFIFKLARFLKTATGKRKVFASFIQDTVLCISMVSVMGKSNPARFSTWILFKDYWCGVQGRSGHWMPVINHRDISLCDSVDCSPMWGYNKWVHRGTHEDPTCQRAAAFVDLWHVHPYLVSPSCQFSQWTFHVDFKLV